MSRSEDSAPSRFWLIAGGVVLVAAAAGAGWYAARSGSDPAASLASADRRAIEQVVREYILTHPEVLPEAMENLQRKQNAKQLSSVRGDVETPFPGAVLGNPDGKITMVEFSDYACGYCRHSVADITALLKKNPDLRIVVREFPILSEESGMAARMALAAAEQGKYEAFYHAMFAAGRPGTETIEAAARSSGMDIDRARRVMASPRVDAEINRNMDIARQLGFSGTPSWVIGDELISGAVGVDALTEALTRKKS